MKIPESIQIYLPQRKQEDSSTTIMVKVAKPGRRKYFKSIDAADIVYCETDNHNMTIHLVDGQVLSVIYRKTELIDILKSVSNKDLAFFAIGKFYIVNLGRTYYNPEAGCLLFRIQEKEHPIRPSRNALADFFNQVSEKQKAEEVRKAEKQTVYVQEANAGSAPSGMHGWIRIEPTRYREVQEYIFEDDKAYLI